MSGDISLYNLVDLSIGTPDLGVVNFTALRTLLHAILDHMQIQHVTTKWTREEECVGQTVTAPPKQKNRSGPGYQDLEDKLRRIETQIALVEELPSVTELLDRSAASAAPVHDMWQLMQLRRQIHTNEDGVSKSLSLVQDLLLEIQELKESRDRLKEKVEEQHTSLDQINSALLADRNTPLDECCHRVHQLEAAARSLRERVDSCPGPEVLEKLVTWEVLQLALLSEREPLHTDLSSGTRGPVPELASPSTHGHPSSPSPPLTLPRPPPSPSDKAAAENGTVPVRGGGASERFPETMEALRVLGRLSDRHGDLEERVEALEAELARPDDAVQLASAGTTDLTEDLLDQMKHLKSQVEDLSSVQEKPDNLQSQIDDMRESSSGDPHGERDTRGERDTQGERDPQGERDTQRAGVKRDTEGKRDPKGQTDTKRQAYTHRPSDPCRLGQGPDLDLALPVSRQVSCLSRSLGKLQEEVRTLTRQQDLIRQHETDVQDAIAHLQEECERLRDTMQHLLGNHDDRQTHIQKLYKSMEVLDEKKADKHLLETEIRIKADKLDSKVSRVQLDEATEQLSAMFQDLVTKVTGQEQGWNQVIDRLSSEMEGKLNRMELDSLKKQLEERWKNISRKLKSQPVPELDDAAGIRRQLVARFHCISCSRPVDMRTMGRHVVTVPSNPGLPSHRSNRPLAVYELEQVPQHCRSPRPGIIRCSLEDGSPARYAPQLEGVQSQAPVQERHPTRTPPLHQVQWRFPLSQAQHERIPEIADYSYLTMSRSCGGSHTLTQPTRRSARFQHLAEIYQPEKVQPGVVDILGFDGHIYKGRLNAKTTRTADPRLPSLSPRESTCNSGGSRVQPSQSQVSCAALGPGPGSPTRPQSTKGPRSRSGSAGSGRVWPVSALGSAADDLRSLADSGGELQHHRPITELHVDLRPPEGEGPGTNL